MLHYGVESLDYFTVLVFMLDVFFCFSPAAAMFASCSFDQTAKLWSTERVFPLRTFIGHTRSVNVSLSSSLFDFLLHSVSRILIILLHRTHLISLTWAHLFHHQYSSHFTHLAHLFHHQYSSHSTHLGSPASSSILISFHSPGLTCSLITTLTIRHYHSFPFPTLITSV